MFNTLSGEAHRLKGRIKLRGSTFFRSFCVSALFPFSFSWRNADHGISGFLQRKLIDLLFTVVPGDPMLICQLHDLLIIHNI